MRTRFLDPFGLAQVNPQDMASLNGLFPGYTPLGGGGRHSRSDALCSGQEDP